MVPHNLLVFQEAVMRMMDDGYTVDVIYFDFAKAFDSINHTFLLSFGLGDADMRWIEAYLPGRVQRVHVSGEHSGPFQCTVVFRRAP